MTEARPLGIDWTLEAKSDLRSIDKKNALDILPCIDRFLALRIGDVKKLRPPESDYRLRCRDYRIFFVYLDEGAISVTNVRNRKDAYR